MSRVLGVIIGVLMVAVGFYCCMTPFETYGVTSWLIAAAMIADGIGMIMLYFDLKKAGISDTMALIGGILSIVFGVILVGSLGMRMAMDVFIAYLAAGWIVVGGFIRIIRAFKLRDIQKMAGETRLGTNWGLALVIGILLVVLGIFCFVNPAIVMIALGWQIGFAVIAGGIGLVTAAA